MICRKISLKNLESPLRRVRPYVVPPQISLSTTEPVVIVPSTSNSMAQKTLHDYFAPSATIIPVGPEVSTGGENFEIKTSLVTMVQANPFCGKANEDARTHLQQFLELCSTFVIECHKTQSSSTVSILSSRESKAVLLC